MRALPFRLSILVLLLALPGAASALEGLLVRADGSPVARAEISLLGHPGGTRSDPQGRFSWSPAPATPFEVLVVLADGTVMPPIRVDALPDHGPLRLEVRLLRQEAVTVTAAAPSIEATPASGTTLLATRELALRAPTNLAQSLENVAGVASLSEGQAAVPAVRGLAGGRTLLLIDGARVTAERRAGPSATYLSPDVLEGVEVARGPGSVAYGSDAFGGVIHARTRRAAPGSGWSGRFAGGLGAGAPQQRGSVELSRGYSSGGATVQGHYRNLDDYQSPDGEVFNSGARMWGARGRWDQFAGPGLISLAWQSDLGRDVERPRNNSREVRFFYPTEDSHRFVASWEAGGVAGFSRLKTSAFLGYYALVTDQDRFATMDEPRSVDRADVSARDFHLRAHAERPLGAAHVQIGADFNGRFGLEALDVDEGYGAGGELVSSDRRVAIESARRVDLGLYGVLGARPSEELSLSGGVRLDRVTTRNGGGFFGDLSTENVALSGFASAALGLFDGFQVTAQLARGFRDPVLSDRYFRGPTGRGFITGNPELESETSLQADIALRYTAARWRLALYGYQYRIDDLIERFEDDPDFFFFRNRGRSRLRGVEVEAQFQLGAGFRLDLSGHLIGGDALDDDEPVADVPPPTLNARLGRTWDRGFAELRTAFYAADERQGSGEEPREGYTLVDVSAGVDVGQPLQLRLSARNLFDTAYRVSTSRRSPLAAGRGLLISAVLQF